MGKIISKIHNYGHEHESEWPPRFGTRTNLITPKEKKKYESKSAFVHQDSFKSPLRHPKTGEMVDSMTRWNEINKEHKLECVGNDLLSKYKPDFKDKITEERFNDAYEQAWSIETDPFKRSQQRNKQREELEKHYDAQAKTMRPSMSKAEMMQMLGYDK